MEKQENANRKIRIGVIGVGIIGKAHLHRYQNIEGAEVVAIADIDQPEADRVGKHFNIPNIYYTAREMLQQEDIEAVDVCLHNNLHLGATLGALQAGKHVYCEKPMAGTYCDALTMFETARKLNKKLSIQLSTLFAPETKAAMSLIERGMLGKIYHARSAGYRRRGRPWVDGYGKMPFVMKKECGGGAMYDMCIYNVGRMLFLMGNPEVQSVSGKVYQELEMDERRRVMSNYDVEEFGFGFARFKNGMTLDIVESWAINVNAFEGSYIVGNKGGVRLDPFGFYQSIGDLDLDATADLESFVTRLHDLHENAHAYDSPQHHWVAVLQDKVPLLGTAELALNHMLIAEGIYFSSKLGREVTTDEIKGMSASQAYSVDEVLR